MVPGDGTTAVPTPGADEALAEAWDTIRARSAELIGGLFSLDSDAAPAYLDITFNDSVIQGIQTGLNPDGDTSVTLTEALGTKYRDANLDGVMQAFTSTVIDALAIGEGVEGPARDSWSQLAEALKAILLAATPK